MEKEIRIIFEEKSKDDGELGFVVKIETKGTISPYELLGILRYYEKHLFMSIAQNSEVKQTYNDKNL